MDYQIVTRFFSPVTFFSLLFLVLLSILWICYVGLVLCEVWGNIFER